MHEPLSFAPKPELPLPEEAGVALAGFDDAGLALCLDAFEHVGRQEGVAVKALWAVGSTRHGDGWAQARSQHPLCANAREEDTLDNALRDPRVLAVFFSAKEAQQRPQDLLRATSAGKHVFCPSPWAQGLVERAKLEGTLANAARWGLTLVCDHARRADPGYCAIRSQREHWADLLGGVDRVDIEFAAAAPRSRLTDIETLSEQADLLGFFDERFTHEPSWMRKAQDEARGWAIDAGAGGLAARLSWRQARGPQDAQERVRFTGPMGSVTAWAQAGVALMTLAGEDLPQTAQEAVQAHPDRVMRLAPSDPVARARQIRRDFLFSALGRGSESARLHSLEDLRRGSFLLCHLMDFPRDIAHWKPSAQMAAAPTRREATWDWGVKSQGPLPVVGRRAVAAREAAQREGAAERGQKPPGANQETIAAPGGARAAEGGSPAGEPASEGEQPSWIAGRAEAASGSLLEKPASELRRLRGLRM